MQAVNKTRGVLGSVGCRITDITQSGGVSVFAILYSVIGCQMFENILLKCFVNDIALCKC